MVRGNELSFKAHWKLEAGRGDSSSRILRIDLLNLRIPC